MKLFVQNILTIFIKIIMIIWGIISLFLLSIVSIAIYIVFKIQLWLFKRKITDSIKKSNQSQSKNNNNDFVVRNTNKQSNASKTKYTSSNTYEVKTITRKLKTKDGDFS